MDSAESAQAYPQAIMCAFLSILCTLLILLPTMMHLRARNIAAFSLFLWIMILQLIDATDALVWPNDKISTWFSGAILCDIQAKVIVGSMSGQPAALMCIMQALARVLNTDRTVNANGADRAEKRRRMGMDIFWCWGVPLMLMLLHYIVQPSRYMVVGMNGCKPMVDNSWPSIPFYTIWPLVFVLADGYYAGLVIYRLHRYRTEFSSILRASSTSKSNFIRLFLMSLTISLFIIPLGIYTFVHNTFSTSFIPYSWSKVHDAQAWNEVLMVPTDGVMDMFHWIRIATAVIAFLFFGLGYDAKRMYRQWAVKCGLGRCWPSLLKEPTRKPTSSWSSSSFASKAKLVVTGKWSWRKNSVGTSTQDSSPQVVKKTLFERLARLFRRSGEDRDSMQLPMWKDQSATPDSPTSIELGERKPSSQTPIVKEVVIGTDVSRAFGKETETGCV
ncbi:MAG: a-factor receptor [Bogoriella megaspora]|nr:MAG: a-factor receptor [Bogoriella megaspora]